MDFQEIWGMGCPFERNDLISEPLETR